MRRSCSDYTMEFRRARRGVRRGNGGIPMRSITAFLALALAMLLAGCFASDRPVFAPETAERPLEPGRYAVFDQYGDQSKPAEYMQIRLRENVYDFVNE